MILLSYTFITNTIDSHNYYDHHYYYNEPSAPKKNVLLKAMPSVSAKSLLPAYHCVDDVRIISNSVPVLSLWTFSHSALVTLKMRLLRAAADTIGVVGKGWLLL